MVLISGIYKNLFEFFLGGNVEEEWEFFKFLDVLREDSGKFVREM